MKEKKMNKLNLFKTKKELNKKLDNLRELYTENTNYLQKQIDKLEATLFKIQNPDGLLNYSWSGWSSYLFVGINYAYNNKIDGARLYTSNENIPYISYKMVTKDNHTYIGLKYRNDKDYSERYFIVDMADNKSLECTNQDIMKNATWITINK
jgi:hypothetical protein